MPINRETNTIGTIQINNETNTKDYFSNTVTSVRLTVFQNNNSEFTRNIRIDDSEQYSRRSCLRLTGVPLPHDKKETATECSEKVKQVLGKLEVQLMNECIDRAHRIGPIKEIKGDNGSSTVQQPIIIKFTNWSTRMAVYRARKKLNGPRIFLDLTTRRAKLLSSAISKVEPIDAIKYAFADINCRLGLKMSDGRLLFFNDETELAKLLE